MSMYWKRSRLHSDLVRMITRGRRGLPKALYPTPKEDGLALKNLKSFAFSSWLIDFFGLQLMHTTPPPAPPSLPRVSSGKCQIEAMSSLASRGRAGFSLYHCLPVLICFLGLGLTWENSLTMEPSDPMMEARGMQRKEASS